MHYEMLQKEGKFGTMTVKNRLVMSGVGVMTGDPGGRPGKREIEYFKERAKGDVGLLITAVTRINDDTGAVSPTQLSMADDKYIAPMAEMVKEIHAQGSKLVVQLHHPGRQNFALFANMAGRIFREGEKHPERWGKMLKMLGSSDTAAMCDPPLSTVAKLLRPNLAPSAVPLAYGDTAIYNQPTRALTVKEILALEDQFAQAALRVKKSGADGVEFHAAHGYLISEFFSPHTNRRTDAYGGSLENRTRFLKEILEKTRALVGPDYPLLVRLNVDEFYRDIGMPGVGLELKEGVQIAKLTEAYGADAIDVSCGTYETLNHLMEVTTYPLGWRTYLAKAVKQEVSIPVIAVGMIRTPDQAESLLENGSMDFIGLGRPLIADPYWMKKAEEGRSEDIVRCIACQTCKMTQMKNAPGGETGRCALNPRACHEYEYPPVGRRNGEQRKVVIVGAGPGGLTAARELAMRDFDVIVYEKEASAGGQLHLADKPPCKEKYAWPTVDLLRAAEKAGAKFLFGHKAEAEEILRQNPYAVILATGSRPRGASVPGASLPNVYTAAQILRGDAELRDRDILLFGSGLTGLETAHYLIKNGGNRISVFDMSKTIAPGGPMQQVHDIVPKLKKAGVAFYLNSKLQEITESGAYIEDLPSKTREFIRADAVVLSLGVVPENSLAQQLKGKCGRVYSVGDAVKGGFIIDATLPAFELARSLE